MKKFLILIFVGFAASLSAEKIIATHTVNATAVSGYAVDRAGNLISYTTAKDANGYVTAVTYTYENKNAEVKSQGEFSRDDIPDKTTDFTIEGLSRKYILAKYTDGTTTTYAVFRLQTRVMKLIRNGTHVASDGEVCWIRGNKILSLTYVDGNPRILRKYTLRWNLSEQKKVVGNGRISIINQDMDTRYVDEAGTAVLTVRIIRP